VTILGASSTSATTAIVVAVISLVASVVAAIVAGMVKLRSDDRITRLSKRLDEEGRERDARRDYEYEAKKRLYEQCEPLLFQALELAESARDRVVSLARSARNGVIKPDGRGWLAAPGYYFTSTAYWLLAPMTTFKLLQGRITSVDLGLEPRLHEQYELLKVLYLSFTNDFDLARAEPQLQYEPDRTDPGERGRERLLAESPQVYARQGLYRGTLEVIVGAFIHREPAGVTSVARCKTFGEFLAEFEDRNSEIYAIRGELDALFRGFHPARKPVLWRVMVTQALLYEELLRAQGARPSGTAFDADRAAAIGDRAPEKLDWLGEAGADGADDRSALVNEPILVARTFVDARTARLQGLVAPPS
jgi:hypothetical protein